MATRYRKHPRLYKFTIPPQEQLLEYFITRHKQLATFDEIYNALPWILSIGYLRVLVSKLRNEFNIASLSGQGYLYLGRKEARGDQLK